MLENKKIGFIGAGVMAEAIVRGLLKVGISPGSLLAYDPSDQRCALCRDELGIEVTDSRSVVRSADIVIIAVKPAVVTDVLEGVCDLLSADKLVISIAAGVRTDTIQEHLAEGVPVVRVMPNTPCLIGAGASALAPGRYADSVHMDLACEIFGSVGLAVRVTEDKLDAVTGLSGSGPAYVYMFIEALADGGVRMGLPKATALKLAAQTVAGAAEMVLETGEHPAELRDRVTTPGGTTITAITSLEKAGFRAAAMDAVAAAAQRSAELSAPKKH